MAGVHPRLTNLFAYLGCSFFTAVAGISMIAQVGVGDPMAGGDYLIASIAAVVVGGASLFGGRGSFIGALFGAFLITQIDVVTVFLHLNQAWRWYLYGFMILVGVSIYSKSRQKAEAM
jgi:ribose transport system ATP-binding protein